MEIADETGAEQASRETIASFDADNPCVDPAWLHVPLWEAVATGCLLSEEYNTLLCACAAPVLYVALGLFLAMFSRPRFAGHLLWTIGISVFCTI